MAWGASPDLVAGLEPGNLARGVIPDPLAVWEPGNLARGASPDVVAGNLRTSEPSQGATPDLDAGLGPRKKSVILDLVAGNPGHLAIGVSPDLVAVVAGREPGNMGTWPRVYQLI